MGDYFNIKTSQFEPLMEDWYLQSSIFETKDCLYLQFAPKNNLNINVSYSLLETFVHSMHRIADLAYLEHDNIDENSFANDYGDEKKNNDDDVYGDDDNVVTGYKKSEIDKQAARLVRIWEEEKSIVIDKNDPSSGSLSASILSQSFTEQDLNSLNVVETHVLHNETEFPLKVELWVNPSCDLEEKMEIKRLLDENSHTYVH